MSQAEIIRRIVALERKRDADYFSRARIDEEAWRSAVGATLNLPGLRGCWPMSGFDSAGDATDMGGLAHHLTYNGNPTYNYDNLVPYIDLDGTGDFLSHIDHADFDILGTETYVASAARGLTVGGWFWTDTLAVQGLLTKSSGVAAASAYELFQFGVGGGISFQINNGAVATASGATAGAVINTWFFAAGRYDPSTEVKAWMNTSTSTNAVGIPAAINNSALPLNIGGFNGTLLLDGRASLCWICAEQLSDAIITAYYENARAAYGLL